MLLNAFSEENMPGGTKPAGQAPDFALACKCFKAGLKDTSLGFAAKNKAFSQFKKLAKSNPAFAARIVALRSPFLFYGNTDLSALADASMFVIVKAIITALLSQFTNNPEIEKSIFRAVADKADVIAALDGSAEPVTGDEIYRLYCKAGCGVEEFCSNGMLIKAADGNAKKGEFCFSFIHPLFFGTALADVISDEKYDCANRLTIVRKLPHGNAFRTYVDAVRVKYSDSIRNIVFYDNDTDRELKEIEFVDGGKLKLDEAATFFPAVERYSAFGTYFSSQKISDIIESKTLDLHTQSVKGGIGLVKCFSPEKLEKLRLPLADYTVSDIIELCRPMSGLKDLGAFGNLKFLNELMAKWPEDKKCDFTLVLSEPDDTAISGKSPFGRIEVVVPTMRPASDGSEGVVDRLAQDNPHYLVAYLPVWNARKAGMNIRTVSLAGWTSTYALYNVDPFRVSFSFLEAVFSLDSITICEREYDKDELAGFEFACGLLCNHFSTEDEEGKAKIRAVFSTFGRIDGYMMRLQTRSELQLDNKRLRTFVEKAIASGSGEALTTKGACSRLGLIGYPKSLEVSYECLVKATEMNDIDGLTYLWFFIDRDLREIEAELSDFEALASSVHDMDSFGDFDSDYSQKKAQWDEIMTRLIGASFALESVDENKFRDPALCSNMAHKNGYHSRIAEVSHRISELGSRMREILTQLTDEIMSKYEE